MKFDNSYRRLPERFYAPATPAPLSHPQLIALNPELAQALDFESERYSKDELANIFSGQTSLDGSHFFSLAYAGHQFGHFNPTMGDGRAILLGEVIAKDGHRYDLQLKGSGPTPFSKRGDGKSALGPVIREYIVSEAMHHLGVPTTRALAAVATGETVFREEELPGGILTRVASSHLRIGTFEYFAARADHTGLAALLDYSLNRLYPHAQGENKALTLLRCVRDAQILLVSKWMSLGFIHGVMNTDNMSISGETIDFGPCAFIDDFNFQQVYSYIDRQGRYAYANQSSILLWNLTQFANTLIPLVDSDEKKAISLLNAELEKVPSLFKKEFHPLILQKLGIDSAPTTTTDALVETWFQYLHQEKIDFTLGFRNLYTLIEGSQNTPDHFYPETEVFLNFLSQWRPLLSAPERMNLVNPLYIPRNHRVESAIQAALKQDYSEFERMNQILKNPFQFQVGCERYATPPREEEKITNTFCGT